MTEAMIVLASALAGFFFADPFFGGSLTKAGPVKALVFVTVWGSVGLHLFGVGLRDPRQLQRSLGAVLRAWWPLLLLGLWIVAGSLYTELVNKIHSNFLNFGLGMLFVVSLALVLDTSRHPALLLKGLVGVYVLTVLAMQAVLVSGAHTFHEEIFLATAGSLYAFSARRWQPLWWLAGCAWLGLCMFSFKNTTFLLVLAMLALGTALLLARTARRMDGLKFLLAMYVGTVLIVSVLAAVYLLWYTQRSELPSGNTEYRLEMYNIAWRDFLHSPLFGTGFTGSYTTYFSLYRVALETQDLPTHSDVLDMLKHGGLLAIGLWLATLWSITRLIVASYRQLALHRPDELEAGWRWMLVLAGVQVGALITYAVNPPLVATVHAYVIWGSAGLMWGLQRYLVQPAIHAPRPYVAARLSQGTWGTVLGQPRPAWRRLLRR